MKNKTVDKLPTITSKQKEILLLLYKFRFLNTNQFHKIFNHKDPHRIKTWLLDLMTKGYVKRHFKRTSFESNTKPAIYFLAPKARQILKSEKELDVSELEYIYKEGKRTQKFIEHSLFLADVYLYLRSQKEMNDELKFFTKSDLQSYEYFPDPPPDAFISIHGQGETTHYFLDFFDDFTPPFAMRRRVRMYFEYAEKPDWDENTDTTPFPKILFILPNESAKKHVSKYASALLQKTYQDTVSYYLTTKIRIVLNEKDNIWQKVE